MILRDVAWEENVEQLWERSFQLAHLFVLGNKLRVVLSRRLPK